MSAHSSRLKRDEILLHLITPGAHHRGNVGLLLMPTGKAPPRDLYTRFQHLREPMRREGGMPHK